MSKMARTSQKQILGLSASLILTLGGCASVTPYMTDDSRYVVHPSEQHNKQFINTASNHRAEHDVNVFRREGGYEYALWLEAAQTPAQTPYQKTLSNLKKSQNLLSPDDHVFIDTSSMVVSDEPSASVAAEPSQKSNLKFTDEFTILESDNPHSEQVEIAQTKSHKNLMGLWYRFCNGEFLSEGQLAQLDFANPPATIIETCDGLK